ncbi:MAG TPA: hypothetical protein VLV86_09625 [Vicinamibacterales bacterium]|nr:hypothetical protein [Vicinamibacterales bacterium]
MANSNPSSLALGTITLGTVRQFDRPLQDEWGLFDPRQAGLEALLRRIRSRAKDTDTADQPPPAEPK